MSYVPENETTEQRQARLRPRLEETHTRTTERENGDDAYVAAAKEAMERPGSYARWVSDDMFLTWGNVLGQSRDSDTVEQSNYRRVLEDLMDYAEYLHPGDGSEYVSDERASHWAVGWVETITVRVLEHKWTCTWCGGLWRDDEGPEGMYCSMAPWEECHGEDIEHDLERAPITADNLTLVFILATDIAIRLRDEYPVYDEEDHSQLESDEHYELWTECVWPDFIRSNSEYSRLDCDGMTFEEISAAIDACKEPLEAIDESELNREAGDYASEDDPSTWDDSEIWEAIVRLAERDAYAMNESEVMIMSNDERTGEHSERGAYVTDQMSLWIQNDGQTIVGARLALKALSTRGLEIFLTRVIKDAQPGDAAWHVSQNLAPNDFARIDWARVAREITEE